MPSISVIVPIYGVEKYLDECIQSIVTQSFTDTEIILIDDGSIDSSGLKCDQWAERDRRIRVIHKPNTGVSDTRNYGLDYAKGKYILFIDADDYYYEKNALAELFIYAETYNLDIVRGEYKKVDEYGNDLYKNPIHKNKLKISRKIISSSTFLTEVMCGEFFLWLALVKRQSIGALRLNRERSFLEDMEFYANLLLQPLRCMFIPLRFYAYRKIPTSVSSIINEKKIIDSFCMCDVFHTCAQKAIDLKLKNVYRYNSIMMYYWTLQTVASNPYFASYKHIIKDCSLIDRQKQVGQWAQKENDHYPIYVYINPYIGTRVMRFELLLKGSILKYSTKCKQFFLRFIDKMHILRK